MDRLLYISLILLGSLLPTRGHAQTTLTLDELRTLAAEQAELTLTARRDLEVATARLEAYAAFLKPRIDLNATVPNYFRTSREVIQDDGSIAFRTIELNNSTVGLTATQRIASTGGELSVESRLQRTDNFSQDFSNYNGSPVRAFFRQPILAFNPWKWDRKLLPRQLQFAERQLETARAEAALLATRVFFDLVAADQERRIAETNREANEALYEIALERYELGQISRGDLIQLELERTSARQNLLRAERLVSAASGQVADLLGRAYRGELLRPTPPATDVEVIDTALARRRLSERPELLAAENDLLLAEREVDRVNRDFGPRLDLELGYGLVRSDMDLEPIYTDPKGERFATLRLSLPILDWGERRARTRAARADATLATRLAQRTRNQIGGELEQLLEQWETVKRELEYATEIRDLSQERFRIAQESYQLGAIPLAELTIAQQTRDRNVRAYVETLRAYWLTYARLARLTA